VKPLPLRFDFIALLPVFAHSNHKSFIYIATTAWLMRNILLDDDNINNNINNNTS